MARAKMDKTSFEIETQFGTIIYMALDIKTMYVDIPKWTSPDGTVYTAEMPVDNIKPNNEGWRNGSLVIRNVEAWFYEHDSTSSSIAPEHVCEHIKSIVETCLNNIPNWAHLLLQAHRINLNNTARNSELRIDNLIDELTKERRMIASCDRELDQLGQPEPQTV